MTSTSGPRGKRQTRDTLARAVVGLITLATAACTQEVAGPSKSNTEQVTTQNVRGSNSVQSNVAPASSTSEVTSTEANRAQDQTLTGFRALRALPVDSLRKWRHDLDRFARSSRRGAASVALRRQILDAISAPSESEFHARLAQLPVIISDSVGSGPHGAAGTYRNYAVYGKTRVSLFRAYNAQPDNIENSASATEALELEDGSDSPALAAYDAAPYASSSSASASITWCEYYSVESGYIEGECATQQEIDEAASTIAAMDAEIYGAQQEAEETAYCLANPWDYETCADQFATYAEADAVRAYGSHELEDGESEEGTFFLNAPCLDEPKGITELRGPVTAESCANDAAMAAIGVAAWVGAKVGAGAVMTAAASPAAAVGWAVFGVLTTGWAAASAINAYINCLNQQ